MASKDYSHFFGTEFPSAFPAIDGFGYDVQSVFDTVRKNIEALTEAQHLAFENLQAIAQYQTDLVNRIVQDNSGYAREIMNESVPEKKIVRHADMMKKSYEKSVDGMRELTEMINKSGLETSDVLTKRVSASFTEIKSVLEKGGKAASSARQKAAA
jgi:phasin family protein